MCVNPRGVKIQGHDSIPFSNKYTIQIEALHLIAGHVFLKLNIT